MNKPTTHPFITWFTNLYPFWLIVAAAIALWHPEACVWFNPWVVPALGFVMFTMGLSLSPADFQGVRRMPGSVAVGFTLHYTIMPFSGWVLAHWLKLDPQFAVGLILVASCPCGTASNLMTYLARGNLALSVCLTLCSTMLAFIMTPLLCQWLAGAYVPVDAVSMSLSTVKIVVVPVLAGAIVNRLAPGLVRRIVPYGQLLATIVFLFVAGGIVSKDASSVMANFGILVLATTLLHVMGFALGFGFARLFGYPLNIARTLSIEVGMQNGGLAAALARANITAMPLAAVPAAFSSILQNIVGGILATWWRGRPVESEAPAVAMTVSTDG
jgi:BASS family bile acid:Na+ symporter